MTVPPELLQFLGSLVAIFALAGLASWMKLGTAPKLTDISEAEAAAKEVRDNYIANDIAIDAHGHGAIMRDASGQVLVLKPHGNKFAGRILEPIANATVRQQTLTIDSGERRYGTVKLEIEDPQDWAEMINTIGNRIGSPKHA